MRRIQVALGVVLVSSCSDPRSVPDAGTPASRCLEVTIAFQLSATAGGPMGVCLPRVLAPTPQSDGTLLRTAKVEAVLPARLHCVDFAGYAPVLDASNHPLLRTPDGWSAAGEVCSIAQVAVDESGVPSTASGANGYFYDTSIDPASPTCLQRFSFTAMARPPIGSIVAIRALEPSPGLCPADLSPPSERTTNIGQPCTWPAPPIGPGGGSCAADAGCFNGGEIAIADRAPECGGASCIVFHWDQFSQPEQQPLRELCTCRCADENGVANPGCTCPSDYRCVPAGNELNSPRLRGSYCIPTAAAPPESSGGS